MEINTPVKVEVKLLANCGCGVVLRAGTGKCFTGADVITEAAAHAEVTGHKMEFYGLVLPEPKPVFISDRPREKRRFSGRDEDDSPRNRR